MDGNGGHHLDKVKIIVRHTLGVYGYSLLILYLLRSFFPESQTTKNKEIRTSVQIVTT